MYVNVCICMYVYMYIHACIFMYIRVYLYIHTCIRIHERFACLERETAILAPRENCGMGSLEIYETYQCVHIQVCKYIYMYVHEYIYVYVHMYMYICIRVCECVGDLHV